MGIVRSISLATLFLGWASFAHAGPCDYRPSQLIGSAGATGAGVVAGGTAAAGGVAKAAGVYTLVNATSGLTMVGGTWAGASAAGTAGIIAGTSGVIGTTVAVITAPATIAAGAVATVVIGTFEGACYFTDTRITDYDEVNAIVRDISITAPASLYLYLPRGEGRNAEIRVRDPNSSETRYNFYKVRNLYIVNGVLKHRDWGFNTTIGLVAKITDPQ